MVLRHFKSRFTSNFAYAFMNKTLTTCFPINQNLIYVFAYSSPVQFHPSPMYPGLHVQLYDPLVLLQTALELQLWVIPSHSLMSEIILKNGYKLSLQSEFLFIFLNSEASTEEKVVKDIHTKNQSFWYRPLIGDKTLKYNTLIIIIIIIIIIIQELI